MSSEGSREIEAAKKRLAAAKAQVSGVSDMTKKADAMMEIAKKNMKAAKSMKQQADLMTVAANKEVEDAQKILADAEKRWDVIEIDQEPDITVHEGGNKRRKVSRVGNNNSEYDERIGNRATIRIPFQHGTKLGLVIVDGTSSARGKVFFFKDTSPIFKCAENLKAANNIERYSGKEEFAKSAI